ncbi:2-oxoglutarate and iron-dependent oxygenase domain-containing protein [Methylocaldum sp. RMAD-M]|uniref:isopenicillin N synthase family dioxygenase n=1 Tax=Methylocaldum sp. RMAD-M TaxID=2806557 RepID=UPI000A325BE9|nr:2-oxoglutarate and iron-dependent oxygenase domain-containing protein [Methylocaldum sp. RMAD-M]MBP1149969.1 isopenicillin N synthase-like dioxygenase [Methylocaldum sp. RMAD-M]
MTHTEAGSESVSNLPIIDVHALVAGTGDKETVAEQIRHACLDMGFFYIKGHGVDEALQDRLEQLSRQFFAQDLETKLELRMERAGRAWRGYFPVGGELTSGRPDLKEGLYFGAELGADDPRVQAGVPLHGANLFPANIPQFRETVLAYMAAMTQLGQILMQGIALSLGLEASYFADRYTADPLILFRIFNYPPEPANVGTPPSWGVGEHTDYGLLTILKQDDAGGLEVKSKSGWIAAPPVPGTFVCNIGDMLDRMTGGRYRSTPHRVRNTAGRSRLSFPFFFDPNFDAEVKRIESPELEHVIDDEEHRWDRSSVHAFTGTYGDYLLNKVGKVFPALGGSVI